MSKWSNLKIGQRLMIIFGTILFIVAVSAVSTIYITSQAKDLARQTKEESAKFALLAKDMEVNIIQVQQWLTDISATRGAEGYDDGFDEAEKNALSFKEGANEFLAMYKEERNTEDIEKITGIVKDFDAFYAMGKKMANEYIGKGHEAGNLFMEKFDPFAAKITEKINLFVDEQVKELNGNMDSILSINNRLSSVSTIMAIIILGTILTLATIFIKGITTPLHAAIAMLKDIAEGEGDLTKRLNISSKDELGDLAKWFNIFIAKIEKIISDVSVNANTLAASSEELSAVSAEMSNSSEQMAAQTQSVAGATEQVSTNIGSMASAVEQMSVNVSTVSSTAEEMSQNMNSVSSAVEEMSMSINDIAKNSQEASKIADKANEMSTSASDTMNVLGTAAQEIGDVTEMIKRIAEQTNLLALNATIEAASAGEAGKGFAVVANEIKELANQSAKAAEQIASKIKGVQDNTDVAVHVITDVSDIIGKINTSVKNISTSVEQQSSAANDIASNVDQTASGANSIAASIAEISKGTNDVSKNASESATGANSVSSNLMGVNKSVTENNSGIRQVRSSSDELSRIAGELNAMISQFKVAA